MMSGYENILFTVVGSRWKLERVAPILYDELRDFVWSMGWLVIPQGFKQ